VVGSTTTTSDWLELDRVRRARSLFGRSHVKEPAQSYELDRRTSPSLRIARASTSRIEAWPPSSQYPTASVARSDEKA